MKITLKRTMSKLFILSLLVMGVVIVYETPVGAASFDCLELCSEAKDECLLEASIEHSSCYFEALSEYQDCAHEAEQDRLECERDCAYWGPCPGNWCETPYDWQMSICYSAYTNATDICDYTWDVEQDFCNDVYGLCASNCPPS